MRPFLFIISALVLMSLSFWAYRENYATQRALKDVSNLNREIAALREALSQQNAEWAYLNRPSRLRDLAALNFDSLGLLPMEPGQFSSVDHVVFPLPPVAAPELGGLIDTVGVLDGAGDASQNGSTNDGEGHIEPPTATSEEPL
ncbi:cell division protein FtsL [Pseudorhodobacter sp. W20_MBD10_FR17]|uniref:cell division protein FtsL n=1 Tax=Pseudorhodobacter sp. W20_MBD10_FR17 TaxID=3240266 RepID=UPI003F98F6AE